MMLMVVFMNFDSVKEARLGEPDIFAGITAGVGKYAGASGYVEIIRDTGTSCLHACAPFSFAKIIHTP
jgi:hypothetical protein